MQVPPPLPVVGRFVRSGFDSLSAGLSAEGVWCTRGIDLGCFLDWKLIFVSCGLCGKTLPVMVGIPVAQLAEALV